VNKRATMCPPGPMRSIPNPYATDDRRHQPSRSPTPGPGPGPEVGEVDPRRVEDHPHRQWAPGGAHGPWVEAGGENPRGWFDTHTDKKKRLDSAPGPKLERGGIGSPPGRHGALPEGEQEGHGEAPARAVPREEQLGGWGGGMGPVRLVVDPMGMGMGGHSRNEGPGLGVESRGSYRYGARGHTGILPSPPCEETLFIPHRRHRGAIRQTRPRRPPPPSRPSAPLGPGAHTGDAVEEPGIGRQRVLRARGAARPDSTRPW